MNIQYARNSLNTNNGYKRLKGRIYQGIGHLRLNQITTRTMQRLVVNLCKPGMNQKTNGVLAPKTVKNYLCLASGIFNYAVSQGLVRDNPCRNVTLPSSSPIERNCYSIEEAQTFLCLLEDAPAHWQSFFTLAIYGGFRRGELFGLEWNDIDFDTGVVTIQRTSLYTKDRGVFTDTPKTSSSRRSLKLPEEVLAVIRKHKAAQIGRSMDTQRSAFRGRRGTTHESQQRAMLVE